MLNISYIEGMTKMKKIIIVLIIISAIGGWGFDLFSIQGNPSFTTITVNAGDLLLINKEHALSASSVPTDIVNAKKYIDYAELTDLSMRLSKKLIKPLNTMLKDANEQGIGHFSINSGYRDFDTQQALYDQLGAAVALPAGHSEHNFALAVDIGSTEGPMGLSEEGVWLAQNAWQYGFTLRYPDGKSDMTGISFEPWHFRYVGLPHSEILFKENWVLEEYLAYLTKNQSYTTQDGYTILYYTSTEQAQKALKEFDVVQISGDNVQGIIVTTKNK